MTTRTSWKHIHLAAALLFPLHLSMMGVDSCVPRDADGDGWSTKDGDCNDEDAAVHPGAEELCDAIDNNCDGEIDEGHDADGDGVADCYDVEECDGLDNNGDGLVDEGFDADGDGVANCFDTEACDNADNDGDGLIDEDNVCDECNAEPDGCLSIWEAHARGEVEIYTSSNTAEVTFVNHSTYPMCLDEQVLYTSDDTQTFFFDGQVVEASRRLEPGQSASLYFGSYTTANNYYSPYYGLDAWWCVENGQSTHAGGHFAYYGEAMPLAISELVNTETDRDQDGVEDHVDWAGSSGVQTQYNIWGYQATHAAMTVGKTATGGGTSVTVTLVSRNVGALQATGTVTDTTPKGWRLTSTVPDPTTKTDNGDGTVTLSFAVDVPGTYGGLTGGGYVILYTLEKTADTDTPYLHLPPATIQYNDGENDQFGYSLDAAVYRLDANGDGTSACNVQ